MTKQFDESAVNRAGSGRFDVKTQSEATNVSLAGSADDRFTQLAFGAMEDSSRRMRAHAGPPNPAEVKEGPRERDPYDRMMRDLVVGQRERAHRFLPAEAIDGRLEQQHHDRAAREVSRFRGRAAGRLLAKMAESGSDAAIIAEEANANPAPRPGLWSRLTGRGR